MRVTIDSADPRPIYAQIMDEVRRGLVVGSLAPDDPVPSVRELAAELRINPNTVAQAYRELEREGLVYMRRGRGTFIAPDAPIDNGARDGLALEVARRALIDAHRNGLGLDELLEALRAVASSDASPKEESA